MKKQLAVVIVTVALLITSAVLVYVVDDQCDDDKVITASTKFSGGFSEDSKCLIDGKAVDIIEGGLKLQVLFLTSEECHCKLYLNMTVETGALSTEYEYTSEKDGLVPHEAIESDGKLSYSDKKTGDTIYMDVDEGVPSSIRIQGDTVVNGEGGYRSVEFDVTSKLSGSARYVVDDSPVDDPPDSVRANISGTENGDSLSGTVTILPVNSYSNYSDDGEYTFTSHVYHCAIEVDGTSLPPELCDFMYSSSTGSGGWSASAFTQDGRLVSYRVTVNMTDEGELFIQGVASEKTLSGENVVKDLNIYFSYEVVA